MNREHTYKLAIEWTGNKGLGTTDYHSYDRSFEIWTENKATILGSSDPAFRGDPNKYNPEELLVAALSTCHMLWFLHLCADNAINIIEYTDNALGIMTESTDGGGLFKEVTLNPTIKINGHADIEKLNHLHTKANKSCFIANSVNFPVFHKPTYRFVIGTI